MFRWDKSKDVEVENGCKMNNKHLPFIIPYDNTTINIGSILKNNWQIISNDETLNTIWS